MTTSYKKKSFVSPDLKLANELINLLEKGVNPWSRPWDKNKNFIGFLNPVTGNCYSGLNVAILEMYSMSRNYEYDLFLGAGQGKKEGLKIKKGSKCVYIVRPQLNSRKENEGKKDEKIYSWTSYKHNAIFNIAEFEDCEKKSELIKKNIGEKIERKEPEKIEEIEKLIKSYHKREKIETEFIGERCFYSSKSDKITMAERKKFKSSIGLYSTWLHEIVHSTGNEKRLNRKLGNSFGSKDYALEELVAETGSFLLTRRLGIGNDIENHKNYLGSWIECLREDPKILIKILGKASKAANYIMEE